MNSIKLLEKLREKSVFHLNDIGRLASAKPSYSKIILNRMVKKGLIKKVVKNAYTTKKNIYVIASNIATPCYISLWSASFFYGYTEQIINRIHVITTRKIKPINFEGYEIKFIPMKHFFGYKKVNSSEGEIFIADNEKLLIDCFLRHKEMGNFDEIVNVFEHAEISGERLINYLKAIGSQTITKRVGCLLEQVRNIDISKNFNIDNNYIKLNPFSKKGSSIITKWRIKK